MTAKELIIVLLQCDLNKKVYISLGPYVDGVYNLNEEDVREGKETIIIDVV